MDGGGCLSRTCVPHVRHPFWYHCFQGSEPSPASAVLVRWEQSIVVASSSPSRPRAVRRLRIPPNVLDGWGLISVTRGYTDPSSTLLGVRRGGGAKRSQTKNATHQTDRCGLLSIVVASILFSSSSLPTATTEPPFHPSTTRNYVPRKHCQGDKAK
jgi:hypothetical protein